MRTPGLFMGVFALALILPVLLACRGSDEPADGPTPRNGPPPRPRWRQTSPETDREALVALYNATDGPNWTFDNNWLSDVPTSEWEGVTTDDNGRVTELSLRGHQLSGEIPPELSNLANLQELGPLREPVEWGDTAGVGQPLQPLQPDISAPQRQRVERVRAKQPGRPVGLWLLCPWRPALLLKPRAPQAGSGRHIVLEALPARIGYGAWRCPSPYQVRSRLIVLIRAAGCTSPPWCCYTIGRAT